MSNKRKNYAHNQQLILFEQVDGRCPMCGKPLMYSKAGKEYKHFQIAHIYPLNPKDSEIIELMNVPKLDDDVNSLKNVIAVCPDCHSKFDKPRTKTEYNKWYKIKQKLQQESEIKNTFQDFNIEEEIIIILKRLNESGIESSLVELSYNSLKIDNKANDTLPFITKQKIKTDVVYYFEFIRECFIDIDKTTPNKFETLASQIRTIYLKLSQTITDQDLIFKALVEWLDEKSDSYSNRACEIIISYFVQDCEVF